MKEDFVTVKFAALPDAWSPPPPEPVELEELFTKVQLLTVKLSLAALTAKSMPPPRPPVPVVELLVMVQPVITAEPGPIPRPPPAEVLVQPLIMQFETTVRFPVAPAMIPPPPKPLVSVPPFSVTPEIV